MSLRTVVAALVATALALLAACGDTGPRDDPPAGPGVALEVLAEVGAPTSFAVLPGTRTAYVGEQRGVVSVLDLDRPGDGLAEVLDLTAEVAAEGEQGLLGLAVAPDATELYVSFTEAPDGTSVVEAFTLDEGVPGERRRLLEVDQPDGNHNGGHLAIGPDGLLYLGLGDGGGEGDPHGHGQDTGTLLGALLRIDPTPEGDRAYRVPPDNPFVEGDGEPEIWAYGLRNPWRFSFDRATGDLWVADVGQFEVEEVNLLPAADGGGRGANLGWNEMEGSKPFEGGTPPPGALDPVHEYGHDDGCSVIGGHVYRGEAIPELIGAYLFADFCAPGLRAIRVDGGEVTETWRWEIDVTGITSLGEDDRGELYVLVGGFEGAVTRLVPGAVVPS